MSLFGTSGIRGDAEKIFTNQFCFYIGRTFIEFLKRIGSLGPVAVGIDPRKSSPRIKEYLLKGLGIDKTELFDEGVTPIPSMNWLIKNTSIKGAIMITGSHIMPTMNGVKMYAHDEEISENDEKLIEEIYFFLKGKEKLPDYQPEVHTETRAKELYTDMLLGQLPTEIPKWKIAVDCANGAQSVLIPDLLRGLGLTVTKVNCDIQDDFIARDTDADDKAMLEDIKRVIVNQTCDFGIAFDGDGDRCVFVDEKGTFVQGEYTCSLIAKQIPGEVVVTTIAASQVIDHIGKKIVRTRVGSPFIVGKMKELGAKFGFEQNGGAVFADHMYSRDGGSVAMQILKLYSKFNGTFSQFIGQLPRFYMARTKIDYKWELKNNIINEVKKKFLGKEIEGTDGLKIWVDNSTWMLFRSSMNAPEFRVFAESKSEKKSKKLLEEGIKFVENIIAKYD